MNAELYQETVGALQRIYPYTSNDDLDLLLIATGVDRRDAFPWHNENSHTKGIDHEGLSGNQ